MIAAVISTLSPRIIWGIVRRDFAGLREGNVGILPMITTVSAMAQAMLGLMAEENVCVYR